MFYKTKWSYISQNERKEVFLMVHKFNEGRLTGYKDKELLVKIFEAYNDLVHFKYPRVRSSVTCGHCVTHVLNFFKQELIKLEENGK